MQNLFKGIYRGKKILLTGHTGFKGSWLQYWLTQLGADVAGFALAPNSNPSHFELIHSNAVSVIGDINNSNAIFQSINSFKPELVFHLAAQPLVRRSYADPIDTFMTNIMGSLHVFEAIRSVGSVKALVNITTDKVYQNKEGGKPFLETDPLGGHDPYSTSKACVELVHESYRKSFFQERGILSATARAGNVIGGGDWAEDRLIPDMVRAATKNTFTEIRNPESIRPWQHVLDPLSGYLLLGQQLLEGNELADDAWNFGPAVGDSLPVKKVLDLFSQHWAGMQWKDVSEQKKLHESNILRLDCRKAQEQLGWMPIWDIHQAIERTACWYKDYYANGKLNTQQDLAQFIADAQLQKAIWTIH